MPRVCGRRIWTPSWFWGGHEQLHRGRIAKLIRIPVYHMEAGDRSLYKYVPEGRSQRMIVHVADFKLLRRRISEASCD